MPRPVKHRRVCGIPKNNRFGPIMNERGCRMEMADEHIRMTVDEYETIRLIDYEGKNQEECSLQMNVSRTTVQGIYIEARKKLADALVNGKVIVIEGGNYKLCSEDEIEHGRKSRCGCRGNGRLKNPSL